MKKVLLKKSKYMFKSSAKTFIRTYSYLSKILEFDKPYWEMLWLFLKHLITKLKIDDDEIDENILDDIDMASYRVNRIGITRIILNGDGGIIEPIPVSSSGGITEKQYDTLENIISYFNKRFGNIDWGEGVDPKEAEKILVEQIPEKIQTDIETLKSILNSDKDMAKDNI